ncbi:MAG TPA: LysR substrate-binding domain-containing protein [Actinomadura sp.]|nr:LysR substrate-binding domain-containing protein [Actinomadura sp.]
MELRHLRYFAAVAETRHFSRAAERLHIAQPPLSQAIRQLETELGVPLLARTTRHVSLTSAGEVFYEDTVRILGMIDDSVLRVQRVAEGSQGVVRIGLTGTASYRRLPEIAHLVKRELPEVVLDIHTEMLTPDQEKALLEGRIDIGLLRPPVREDGIAVRTIAREPLVLVVPERHPLAERTEIAMADLRAENFIMYASHGSVVNDAVVHSCLAAGFYPHREHAVEGTSILLAMVSAGLGVALVPDSVQAITLDGVAFRQVTDAGSVDLALAWTAADTSPLVSKFLSVLEAAGVFSPDESDRETM